LPLRASPPLVADQRAARPAAVNRAAIALGAAFGLLWLTMGLLRHAAYASGRQDLEIYLQVLWSTAQGRPFASTLLKSNELHLAEHLALSLLPLMPLYALMPRPELPIVLQQAAWALAGAPVFWLARRLIGPPGGLALLVGFYLTPALAGAALDDFHPVTFVALPVGASAALLAAGRWRTGVCVALLACLLEEEAALPLAGLGLWLVLGRCRRVGLALIAYGVGLLAASTLAIMPGYHQPATVAAVQGNRALGHFSELRADGAAFLGRLLYTRGEDLLSSYLVANGGMALLAPSALLAAGPTLGALLLQDREDTLHRHWAAPALPLIWVAAALGLSRLRGRSRHAGVGIVLVGALLAYVLISPLPAGRRFERDEFVRGPHEVDLDLAVAAVSLAARLAVSENVAAHLANRQELFLFPIDDHYLRDLGYEERPLDGYVLDLQEPSTQRVAPLRRSSPLLADPPYVVWSSGHKVMLLTREEPTPRVSIGATFNRRMRLLGYDLDPSSGWLTLYWQTVRDIFSDFERVLELTAAAGQPLLRDRSLPLTNVFSTDKWRVGQLVIDRVELPSSPASDWRMRVAWQNRDRGTPMPLDGGGEALELVLETGP
jgi:uncharacterized membrane protein